MPDSSSKTRRWLGLALFVAAALAAGYAFGSLAKSSPALVAALRPLKQISPVLLIAAIAGSAFLVILVHELGHLAGGWIAGFRFALLIVGPLQLERTGDNVRLRFNRQLALWGGIAVCLPTSTADLRRKMATMVIAGPVASLLLALLALPLTLISPAFLFIAVLSAGITLVTGIPARTGPFYTDGARVRMLFQGGPEAERWIAVCLAYSYTLNGTRPRNWPADLVAQLALYADATLDGIGCALQSYSAAMDRGDLDSAARWIDYLLTHQDARSAHLKAPLMLEAAYFTARHRHDAVRARQYLDQTAGGLMIEPATRLRSEAAVLFAEGQIDAARRTIQRALELAGASATPTARLEAEWLAADRAYYSQPDSPRVAS